jgi:hypothetical protein
VPPAKFHVPVSFGSMILLLPYSNFAGSKIVVLDGLSFDINRLLKGFIGYYASLKICFRHFLNVANKGVASKGVVVNKPL